MVKAVGWSARAVYLLRSALKQSETNMKKNNLSASRSLLMNSYFLSFSLSLMAILSSSNILAANLQALDVASLPGDRVELKLTFDEAILAPKGYTIEQPARIALDMPGVANKLGVKNKELGVGNARSVTVVEAKDRTRLIINLTNLAPYSTRVEGSTLFVVVGEGAAASAGPAMASPPVV
jgi:type IV pilus assembly protein PilQ